MNGGQRFSCQIGLVPPVVGNVTSRQLDERIRLDPPANSVWPVRVRFGLEPGKDEPAEPTAFYECDVQFGDGQRMRNEPLTVAACS